MKNRGPASLFLFSTILILVSCGIDDYIYLKPVTTTDWRSSNQSITFTIPTSQTEGYFREYVIYYRLYPSDISKIPQSFLVSDFSSINAAMYSDYVAIYPYSIEDDKAPVNLQYLFETTLGFKELSFGTAVTTKSALSSVSVIDETPLTASSSGKTVTIDFNLLSLGTAHPCLIIDSQKLRLLRIEATSTVPSRDFLKYTTASGTDFEGTAKQYTYAIFYIVAKGIDDSFSTLLSRATFLGALQLPEVPSS
jgi:hypothetical protein